MKGDIVPYDKETAIKLAAVMHKLGVPCVGPQTGIELIKVASRVSSICQDNEMHWEPAALQVLKDFEARLLDICQISGEMQKIIIDKLEQIQKGQK